MDFNSSRKAFIEAQKYSPFEMGLGRLVTLDKRPFVGRDALAAEQRRGPSKLVVGLEVDWTDVESVHDRIGLTPVAPAAASEMEITVEAARHRVGATVVPTPFFNPPRNIANASRDHLQQRLFAGAVLPYHRLMRENEIQCCLVGPPVVTDSGAAEAAAAVA